MKKNENLFQKLYNRQVFGQFVKGKSIQHEPARQLFQQVPDRLIFKLRDTIPNVGNHVLMGATRCGQILLTYTYSIESSSYLPTFLYRYRLHFWLFRPGLLSAKIAEVQLFDGARINEMLSIGIVQWSDDNRRLLVYGFGGGPMADDGDVEYKGSTYITMTTLPSLNGCDKCKLVASSFGEDEMAANWDDGVGLTCFNHGLTLHTHFFTSHRYIPDPRTCVASQGRVVFNTGSFLHVLSMRVEHSLETKKQPDTLSHRLSHTFLRSHKYSLFLTDGWDCKMIQLLIKKLQQGLQVEYTQLSPYLQFAFKRHTTWLNRCKFREGNMTCSDIALMLLDTNKPAKRWFSNSLIVPIDQNRPSGNVYDFLESEEMKEMNCEPKFKLYRRRRLADKMYEFTADDDHENIRPKKAKLSNKFYDENADISSIVKSIIADWDVGVVEDEAEKREKTVHSFMSGLDCQQNSWSPLKPHNKEYKSPKKIQKRAPRRPKIELTDDMKKEVESGLGHQSVSGCSVAFTRTYIETDQEIISTITDVDDDEISPGFHCALPVSVHGSSYTQLEMISNFKATKLSCPLAIVRQSSLDIEHFCYKASEYICHMEGYKFWFSSDYDTEIVKVCPETCEVLGVLFITLNAERWSNITAERLKADLRNFYETACLYIWNPTSGAVYLEGYKELRKINLDTTRRTPWCPARNEANQLRQACLPFRPSLPPRFLLHQIKRGTLQLHRPLNVILDHDNLIGFRL